MSVTTQILPITVAIISPQNSTNSLAVTIRIDPQETAEQSLLVTYPFIIKTKPIAVNITEPLLSSSFEFLKSALAVYIDEDRELKTLLNYGEDRQSVILAKRYGPLDANNLPTMQLKLLQPVPDSIDTNLPVFLSREVANTLIDKVRVRFADEIDATPYLKPPNLAANTNIRLGKSLNNVTLKLLSLQTGSSGADDAYQNKTFEDQIFRQWYSYDFNSSELNIDFTDYNNFVYYGSAAMRLAAFREKLKSLELIDINRIQFLSSSTYSPNSSSAGFLFVQEKAAEYAKEKENIIRAFDRYEQYLYFTPSGSNSPYTASAFYADNGYEYNELAYWPKDASGSIYLTYHPSSSAWYETQSLIAQRFDEFNENNVINTIPMHVREDDNSSAYITFVAMIGHFFDTIKPYVDQFPYIHSRNLNPNTELSKDLISEIAESVGFTLPTLNSTYDLTDNILGSIEETPRRDLTAEIYKRLLHNLPFFAKAKGTKTSLDALLKTFGITPQLISVRETGTPVTSSYYVYDEFSSGLDFDETKTSYISLPFEASARFPTTLQFNCTLAKNKTMTVLTGDTKWALNVVPHPTNINFGKLQIVSGSSGTVLMSSSYHELFGDELISVTIQDYLSTSSLFVTQVEGQDIIFSSSVSAPTAFSSLWQSTQFVYIGGAGSLVQSRFDGTIDEVRVWNSVLTTDTMLNTAFDPGASAGESYESAATNLLIQLSFNNLDTGSLGLPSSSINNESSYKNITDAPSLSYIQAFNISGSDLSRYSRTIRQPMIQAGTSAYLTTKVKVAPPPTFLSETDGKRLYINKSIVSPQQKTIQRGRNKVILALSPTEIINQNIIRTMGTENINNVIGLPSTLFTNYQKSLKLIKDYYSQYYYVDVNTNRFIRIMSELSSILNQVVDYFIPSKATLLKGIIIEPNVLEQLRILSTENISVYGKDTKKTLRASSGSKENGTTFNVQQEIVAVDASTAAGNYNTYQTQLDEIHVANVRGDTSPKTATVEMHAQPVAKTDKYSATVTASATPIVKYIGWSGNIETNETFVNQFTAYAGTISPELPIALATYPTYTASVQITEREISGSYLNVEDTISINNISSFDTSYITYNIKHEDWSFKRSNELLSGSSPKASSIDIGLVNMNKIPFKSSNKGGIAAEPYNRIYARKLFDSEINTPRNGGLTSIYEPALKEIPPSADFRDFGVYTFFNNDGGVYRFPQVYYTPAYNYPLNQTWNFSLQTFDNITNWEYGASYKQHDVVYQNITNADSSNLLNLLSSARAGNGNYYVFKTTPSYRQPSEDIYWYSGSVSSHVPPSLDKKNWEILLFKPSIKNVLKRVIFDTFVVRDPSLNNFKTTTVSVDKIIDIPDRYIDVFDVPGVQGNTYTTGDFSVQNMAVLFAIQSNYAQLRLRLYRTSDARDADISRISGVFPVGSHGVLLDTSITTNTELELINPITTLIADNSPPKGKIYYTIDNLESFSKIGVSLTMYYFAIEIEPRIPVGYLRKHYRFFRDTSLATKRRNYLGCLNTKSTTIDGRDPVEIFLSEGTEITISSTQTNTEITTGGGGTLNAT